MEESKDESSRTVNVDEPYGKDHSVEKREAVADSTGFDFGFRNSSDGHAGRFFFGNGNGNSTEGAVPFPVNKRLAALQRPSVQRSVSDPHMHQVGVHDTFSAVASRARLPRFFSASHSVRSEVRPYNPRPYFRSRRIKKGTIDRPELHEKDPRAIWITILPLLGFIFGFSIIAVMSWSGYSSVTNHEYCEVFIDDFSGGFNTSIWTKQVETGGFENGEFEMTTADDENVFIRDGQLVIRPSLQTESYLATTSVTNLTADGTCTSTLSSACILAANITAGEIVQPVKSGRIVTKNAAVIRYGRVEITAKLAAGDWLLSEMMMFPALDYYGSWPASGEIDIGIARGNNYTYNDGKGNQLTQSSLHWGPDETEDRWQTTTGARDALHATYHQAFHTFGLEWTEKYLFTWIDSRLAQVMYVKFDATFFKSGGFGATYGNGTLIADPWSGKGTSKSTPFDRPFYLTMGVGVGGTSGWFADGVQGKPWADASVTPRKDFWKARDQWAPTWNKSGYGEMVVKKVSMWQQCDNGATDLSGFE